MSIDEYKAKVVELMRAGKCLDEIASCVLWCSEGTYGLAEVIDHEIVASLIAEGRRGEADRLMDLLESQTDMNCETCGQRMASFGPTSSLRWCGRCGTIVLDGAASVPAIVKAARERLLHPEVDMIADQLEECCYK